MPRAKRNIIPGQHYYLEVVSSQRLRIFHDSEDYETYSSLVEKAALKTKVTVSRHVLMPSSAFFIIEPKNNEISGFLRLTQLGYARYYCRKYAKNGHIWQGHAKCRLINKYFIKAYGTYIENYPVESGLVKNSQDWPYSSSPGNCLQNKEWKHPIEQPKTTQLNSNHATKRTEEPGKFIIIGSRYNGTRNKVWIPIIQKMQRPHSLQKQKGRPP